MRILELCSGIGGFSLAAHWMGWQTVGMCEIDPYCQRILRKNFPGVPIFDDLKNLTGELIREQCGEIDLICGGWPCQPFSVAGKQRGKADDRHLWPEVFRLIQETRPRWVVGENVSGFIKLALDDVLSDLESEGYSAEAIVLPACAVNAIHRRDRVWVIAKALSPRLSRAIPISKAERTHASTVHANGEADSDADEPGSQRRTFSGTLSQEGAQSAHQQPVRRNRDWFTGTHRHANSKGKSDVAFNEEVEELRGDANDSDPTEQGLPQRSVFPLERPQPESQPERPDDQRKGRDVEPTRQPIATHPRETQPGICLLDDGLSARLAGRIDGLASWAGGEWEMPEPLVEGKVPERTSKLKALGNAVVPVLVYEIFKAIEKADR